MDSGKSFDVVGIEAANKRSRGRARRSRFGLVNQSYCRSFWYNTRTPNHCSPNVISAVAKRNFFSSESASLYSGSRSSRAQVAEFG